MCVWLSLGSAGLSVSKFINDDVKFFLSPSETSCFYMLFIAPRLLLRLKSMILCVYPCRTQKNVSLVRKVVGRQVRCVVCMWQAWCVLTFTVYLSMVGVTCDAMFCFLVGWKQIVLWCSISWTTHTNTLWKNVVWLMHSKIYFLF
jgi:hypothetical protein